MKADRHKWNCGTGGHSSLLLGLVLIALAGGLSGCGTLSAAKKSDAETRQRRALVMELKKTKAKLDELRERNIVLEKRRRVQSRGVAEEGSTDVPVPFTPTRAAKSPKKVPVIQAAERREPTIENVGSAETGEHFLYSKVLETFRKRNGAEMQKSLHLLLKTYPDSVFADNALYLTGLLALDLGDLARARSYMDRVIKDYPRGNKAVAALFAVASIEKRKKNYNDAKHLLEKVRVQYPGSPEAARVGLELKILQLEAETRRES